MLELLRIHDLALIEDVELEFSSGFNALTGETGAGKSFILRAIDFLTGERMSSDMIRPGKEKAVVEALFVSKEGELIIRRELAADTGRSRVYVNDRLSSQEVIRELRPQLIVYTSQHGQQKLLSPAHQSTLLDAFVMDQSMVQKTQALKTEMSTLLLSKADIIQKAEHLEQQRDFLEYQKSEIAKVQPIQGEEEKLEALRHALREQDKAAESIQHSLELLSSEHGLTAQMDELSHHMTKFATLTPELAAEQNFIEEVRHRLRDLGSILRRGFRGSELEGNLDTIEARLYELSRLKRSLKRSLPEIFGLQAEVEDNLSFLDSCALELAQLEKKEQNLAIQLEKILRQLNAQRRVSAEIFCRNIEGELKHLGFSEHVKVDVAFSENEIYPNIYELKGRLLWIPNPGQSPQPLDKIASGGELSRFMLAMTALLAAPEANIPDAQRPSLLFDEVDAGVGGLTLQTLADKLSQLAQQQQVLVITHWPQIAAKATRHFTIAKEVHKGQTFTRCKKLSEQEVRMELERMAGGGRQGQAMAQELLEQN